MLKMIRENYLDRAEAFASSTGLPPEIIRNFLSDDGKKSPYEIARRISSHFGESPECMCREADVDDFLPLRNKRIAEVFDNLDETPFIVCDTSLEPLGIEKNDMLLLEECDVADIDELIKEYRKKYKDKEYFTKPRFDKVGITTNLPQQRLCGNKHTRIYEKINCQFSLQGQELYSL